MATTILTVQDLSKRFITEEIFADVGYMNDIRWI